MVVSIRGGLRGCVFGVALSCTPVPEVPSSAAALPPATRGPITRPSFCVEPVTTPVDDWMSTAAALGVGTIGVNEVSWETFEPDPPTPDGPAYSAPAWSLLDTVVDRAMQHDLRLQLTVQVRSPWGTASTERGIGAPGSSPVLPPAQPAFERWLGDLMTTADPDGTGLVVMLGNELEAPGHWNGSDATPADATAYTALVADAARIRDGVAPATELWRASTNFGPLFDDGPDSATLDERLAPLSGVGAALIDAAFAGDLAVDRFSLHPNYAAAGVWHQAAWVRAQLPPGVTLVAEDMRSVRIEGLDGPGWPDEDGDGTPDISSQVADGDPEARRTWHHAQAVTLSQKLALGLGSGLEVMCLSTLMDFPETYPLATWHHTGLVDDDGTPRPAYAAYRLWIEALTGWTPHEALSVGGPWVIPFSNGDARALVAWGTGDWQLPEDWPPITDARRPPTTADEVGWQPATWESDGLSLTEMPVYVELGAVAP